MYSKKDLIGIIFFILLVIFLSIVVIFLIPKVIIWICLGLFNIDFSDRYWHIFAAWMILCILFNGNITIDKK